MQTVNDLRDFVIHLPAFKFHGLNAGSKVLSHYELFVSLPRRGSSFTKCCPSRSIWITYIPGIDLSSVLNLYSHMKLNVCIYLRTVCLLS